jgi:MFS family permease
MQNRRGVRIRSNRRLQHMSPGPSRMFRSLRHRNYRLFVFGQIISLIGTWMQSVAESWLVYRLTGSAVLLGWVGFSSQIPVFLMSPFGGAIADRHDRRHIIMTTQVSSMVLALLLATLVFTGRIQVWHILTIAALLGVVNAFDIPARQSFLLEMVTRDDLPNAIALNSSMFNGARIIGPAVAGVLVASIGEGWCFLANGLSYIAVIAGLLMMRLPKRIVQPQNTSTLEHILEGFRFVARTPPIRALLILLGIISLVGMPYVVLMPVFAREIFGGGASTLGVLMSSTGIGALAGALILARRQGFKGLGRLIAVSAGSFGAALVLFSFSRIFFVSVALLFPVGMFMMMQMASSNTLVQAMVPDSLRGRVMSVYSMMFMGMAPFGALLAGWLAHWIGAPWVVALGGASSIVAGSLFASMLPRIRPHARELILAQQAAAGVPLEGVTANMSK